MSNFSIRQGDTVTKTLTVTDDADVAIDLTGATLTMHLRAKGSTTDALSVALSLTTPTSGIATLTLSAAQTAALSAATTYLYEVECVDTLGNVTTPVAGLLYVQEDRG